jgi:hypothetical protein
VGYQYHPKVREQLALHGLAPRHDTPPARVRDALSDLYRYEIRRLRSELLAGRIPKSAYAQYVTNLRNRYWLLSIPVEMWAESAG